MTSVQRLHDITWRSSHVLGTFSADSTSMDIVQSSTRFHDQTKMFWILEGGLGSRQHHVCTTSRFGGVLKTSWERVHDRSLIGIILVLLQSIARLENHTKTSYLCNTFCESTRLRDVFSSSQQEHVTDMCHVCTTSAPRVYDVCTTSRFGSALKTSLERVHGRYWIRVFQVLLQFPERLENHTKTSYLCNTFCESTRLRDVFSVSQQENVTVRSSKRLCHICTTSVPRLYDVCVMFVRRLHDVTFWWRIKNVIRTCPWQVLDTCFSSVIAVPRTFGKPHKDVLPM